ncbi:MAG: hypothetical protein J5941_04900 [Solobacterium sp.]|nr:hypothetical protein [Solobacterium sp.]
MIDTRDFKYANMREGFSGTQTDFLVQNALQEVLCVQESLHVHVGFTVMNKLDCGEACGDIIRFIDDSVVIGIDAECSTQFTDFCLITDQDRIHDTELVCFTDCLKDSLILCTCDG